MQRFLLSLIIFCAAISHCFAEKAKITAPPAEFNLDSFYKKYLDCDGIVVIGSEMVDDKAFYRLKELLDKILENRPDLRQSLVDAGFQYIIVAEEEQITDVPRYTQMKPKAYWDQRVRGFGGRTTSCGEENLLNLPGDRYDDESIFIHELAHGMHRPGLYNCEPEFQERLDALYQKAMNKGLYKFDYASTNSAEYWAEGVQAFFDCDRENNWNHNHINTREELIDYDPEMAEFIREIFKINEENDWRFVRLKDLMVVQNIDTLGQDESFSKLVYFWDFSVLGTESTSDVMMLKTANVVRSMFRYRYDILKTMIDENISLAVYDKLPSNIRDDRLEVDTLVSMRNGKAFPYLPDNMQLSIDSDTQKDLVHDLALAAYIYTGLRPVDPDFEDRRHKQQYEIGLQRIDRIFDQKVQELHKNAIDKGLWQSTSLAENRFEYFAHGTSLFYDAGSIKLSNGEILCSREQLAEYDPALERFIADTFKHTERMDWRYAMSN